MTTLPEAATHRMDQHPTAILQQLIRFDTTNPPGHEAACIGYIRALLSAAGIESLLLERTPGRPNLIARLPGRGTAPPLLLYGHVDVVTTVDQEWQHPPFAGDLVDGYVWGRGALDMKGGVAMMLATVLRAHTERWELPGDVVLCIVSDEENGGTDGARFLVEQHADLFTHIRYALGEFGGFSIQIGPRRFYPIMVAEKQICWMRATLRGPGGHGSLPIRGGAMAELGTLLQRLDRQRLPVHLTPVARLMIGQIAAALPAPGNLLFAQLLNPRLTDRVLDLLGPRGRIFDPLLHHTVSPTIVRGGEKVNVIPSAITLDLDGRMLPGFAPAEMLAELQALAGPQVQVEVVQFDPGPREPDLGLFGTLAATLRELDPTGVPIPLLLSGVTDGRFFARLGIQTYGFLPMQLPPDFNFAQTIHAANERIPVAALEFGSAAIGQVLRANHS
jgi:acetylornithine deacetylase/succinyl-diaminopimelate desuccinylase-like protein